MSLEGQHLGAAAAKVSRRLIYRPISPPHRVRFSGASHLTDDTPTTGARVKTPVEEGTRGVAMHFVEDTRWLVDKGSSKEARRGICNK